MGSGKGTLAPFVGWDANENAGNQTNKWYSCVGLNHGPPDPQSGALTN